MPTRGTRGAGSSSATGEEAGPPEMLSIGELAKRTGVSTRTIRYYEELGILPTPERTVGGTRRYPSDYIFYVEGARLLKQLGFGLEEIAELGQFALTGTSASKRTQAILQQKMAELEHRIKVLTRLKDLVAGATKTRQLSEPPVSALLRWVSEENNGKAANGFAGSQAR